MEVYFQNLTEIESYDRYEAWALEVFQAFHAFMNQPENAVANVILVDNQAIHAMNAHYREIDRETDVLSFPEGTEMDGEWVLGDIIVSYEKVLEQMDAYGHSEKREFCFLVCHGLLHLIGYDHLTPEDEVEMFGLQDKIMEGVAQRHA